MVKRICWTVMIVWGCMTGLSAQNHHKKFSPEKFEQELKQFITQEAKLTQDEAAKFFPVGPRITTHPPVIYSQPCSPTPSTTAVAPELRIQNRSPAIPAM